MAHKTGTKTTRMEWLFALLTGQSAPHKPHTPPTDNYAQTTDKQQKDQIAHPITSDTTIEQIPEHKPEHIKDRT